MMLGLWFLECHTIVRCWNLLSVCIDKAFKNLKITYWNWGFSASFCAPKYICICVHAHTEAYIHGM